MSGDLRNLLSDLSHVDPTKVIKNMVDEFGNQVKIGDEEDIGEVSEGLMARIHEAVESILNEEMPDQSIDDMFSEQGDHS